MKVQATTYIISTYNLDIPFQKTSFVILDLPLIKFSNLLLLSLFLLLLLLLFKLFSASDFKSDVLLLSKVRNMVIFMGKEANWGTEWLRPNEAQRSRERPNEVQRGSVRQSAWGTKRPKRGPMRHREAQWGRNWLRHRETQKRPNEAQWDPKEVKRGPMRHRGQKLEIWC